MVGAAALGSAAVTYLAAAGVGRVGVVDRAEVGPSDSAGAALQWGPDVGRNRAESACAKLGLMSPDVQADPYPVELDEANARAIVTGSDVALECSSSSVTRALVNDACCAEGVPFVTAALAGLGGVVMAVRPGRSACWRCACAGSGAEPAAGEPAGPAAVAGAVGSLQALEALKLLTGVTRPLLDRLLRLDLSLPGCELVPVERRTDCPACGAPGASPQSR